jgi:pimeloyl-ACP methyl ester carboxylesterase
MPQSAASQPQQPQKLAPGQCLHYRRSGQATHQTLLLIHGMGSASTAWKLITPRLEERYQVLALDLPGHGASELIPGQEMDPESLAHLIASELRSMGLEKIHVAGNSLGGWIALELAAIYPDLVQSVCALAPAGLWREPATHREKRGALARYLATATHRVAPVLMRYQWARRIGFAVVSPLWRELPYETCVDATIAYGTSEGYYPAWDGMLRQRFEKRDLISPKIPVSIVFGDHDNTLPEEHSQERSLAPAHCEWIRISQSGHAPMWDHTAEVVDIVVETINRTKPE